MFRNYYIKDAKNSKGKQVIVAGWVHEFRNIGKVRFIVLRDKTGFVQVTAKKGAVSDSLLEQFQFNREDVLSISGKVVENSIAPDGVEIIPEKIEILNKVERKLPVDPSDVVPSDLDIRLDFRYIDLRRKIPNSIFNVKSAIAQAFREKVLELGFQEIHPTSLTGAATEGGTDVFAVEYFDKKAFLAQSPQLYKQLAVIGGMDKVFMITPVFRAEKHATTTHLNEIIQMDVEIGFADHLEAMDILEKVFLHILKKIHSMKNELSILNADFEVPKAVKKYTYDEVISLLNENNFKIAWGEDLSKDAEKKLDEIITEDAYFIHEWPTNTRAFYSMPKEEKEDVCNAFDLIYKGLEISSGAQRIHIPALLEKALIKRNLDPKDFQFYIDAFRVGAPPHSGWSIGLERITQKLTNQSNIRECMLFPRDRYRLNP
ncbi:MAG: aspartate--tRNA(Asn) ligase [Candidatus ainarchaeum sp.]|nr:aspartate--tRNA(Asn) ligase [Candidatus ainarchaeum sp.]